MPGWTDLHVHLAQRVQPAELFRRLPPRRRRLRVPLGRLREEDADGRLHQRARPRRRSERRTCATRSTRAWSTARASSPPASRSPPPAATPIPPTATTTQLSHLLGPPGPTEGVINSIDDARQAVRQRYKDGSDVIKITATGGVLSLREVRRRAAVHRRGSQGDRRHREGLRLPRRRARARQGRHEARGARRRHHASSTAPT